MITIIVPTFGRPDRLKAVAANIHAATVADHCILFVTEHDDQASCLAADAVSRDMDPVVTWAENRRAHNYAGAVNTGYFLGAAGDYIFTGADDLRFHDGWDQQVLRVMEGDIRVGGTNDLLNPYVQQQTHATHYLVDNRYIDETGGVPGEPAGTVLFEGYDHNYTDTEFIDVAKSRGVFAPCMSSVVEHVHVVAGKAPWDDTYRKGHAHMQDDYVIFKSREHLWTDNPDHRKLI